MKRMTKDGVCDAVSRVRKLMYWQREELIKIKRRLNKRFCLGVKANIRRHEI